MTQRTAKDGSLDLYIAQVNRHALLTREQEHELATRYQTTHNPADYQKLVVCNLRFVVKLAHQYRGYDLKLLDLIQEGNLGLMMAAQKFEPSRGYRFISYAVWWVRAYMQNYIMRSWSLVKVGTTQAQRKLFFKLKGAEDRAVRLAAQGDGPTLEELAETLGVAPHEVQSMQGRLAARDFSLDGARHAGATSGPTWGDQLQDLSPGADVEAQVLDEHQRQLVRRQAHRAMAHLNPKERYILAHRLMCDEPQTLQQIGTRFSISRERARQIESAVKRKMGHVLKGLGPDGGASRAA
jgi:RNA polymerase sigma-32 factor